MIRGFSGTLDYESRCLRIGEALDNHCSLKKLYFGGYCGFIPVMVLMIRLLSCYAKLWNLIDIWGS